MGFRVWDLGFRVWGLGFRVEALEEPCFEGQFVVAVAADPTFWLIAQDAENQDSD